MVFDDEILSKAEFDGYLDSIQLPYVKKSYAARGTLSCQEQNVNGLLEDVVFKRVGPSQNRIFLIVQ